MSELLVKILQTTVVEKLFLHHTFPYVLLEDNKEES